MERRIPLGSFELIEPLGQGGMATVWRAIHVPQGVPVAVKVITAINAREPLFLHAFESEVRAVARLDHPGIVMILDHGSTSEATERESNGEIAANSPYLAMELATGGSFDRLNRALSWPELSQLLHALLDALAHAHARGVLHRDLKPANLLVSGPKDQRTGLKLTDFGIAHALERDGPPQAHEIGGGTPTFMAPEQLDNAWRDYGPWTDLYSLGCMAFLYATGKAPFSGDTPIQLALAHLQTPPPRLVPVHPMPGELEAWIRRLLEKAPKDRYHRAADAAWALAEIAPSRSHKRSERSRIPSGAVSGAMVWSEARPEEMQTETLNLEFIETLPWQHDTDELQKDDLLAILHEDSGPKADAPTSILYLSEEPPPPLERVVPPLPLAWQRPQPPSPVYQLWGVGLGLFGIRPIPMVGRERERDVIWHALHRVRDERRARLVLLQGTGGVGKSRLAEVIAQRAGEVGNGLVFRAGAAQEGDPLQRMLARYLRLEDLDHASVLARAEKVLSAVGATDPADWFALTELVFPLDRETRPPGWPRLRSAPERHAIVRRVLHLYASERPLVVILDDVHLSSDLILFARSLLEVQTRSPSPVLVLLTAREEALAERPQETSLLHQLMASEYADRLAISPLNPDDHLRLVHELLGLEQQLAHQVARRTAGNPSFAVELVSDWVQRGALELGPMGFRLPAGESAVIPDGIHDVWAQRLGLLLEEEPADASLGLELGAMLGRSVSQVEWSAICARAGVPFPEHLVEALVFQRLLQPTTKGWIFAHGMLCETIERLARESGRLPAHHRAAAEMLLERYGLRSPGVAERIGLHYAHAGQHKEALAPLLIGAEDRIRTSEYLEAQGLLRSYERSLQAIGAPRADARWCECWLLRARIGEIQGSYQEAASLARRALDGALRWDLKPVQAGAKLVLASVASQVSELQGALDLFREAQGLYMDLNDSEGIARCHLGTGDVRYRLGNLAGAADRYNDALEYLAGESSKLESASCLWGLGYVAMWRGQFDLAEDYFQRQKMLSEEAGNRHGVARCIAGSAEIARLKADYPAAEEGYKAALKIFEAVGARETITSYLNLASTAVGAGRAQEASRMAETVRTSIGPFVEGLLEVSIATVMLPACAERQEWAEFDRIMDRVEEVLDSTRLADGDTAWLCRFIAEKAHDHGSTERAKRVLDLALRQWRALGRHDLVDETRKLSAQL